MNQLKGVVAEKGACRFISVSTVEVSL